MNLSTLQGFQTIMFFSKNKARPVEQFMAGSWVADWKGGLIILKRSSSLSSRYLKILSSTHVFYSFVLVIVVLGVIDVKYLKEKTHVTKLIVLKHRIEDAENENSNSVFCILLCQIS